MISSNENKGLRGTLTAAAAGQRSAKVGGANPDAFQERMRKLVQAQGSIARVARNSGISESTVKNWVDGVADPSRQRCIALAEGTGVSLLWLVAGQGPMQADQTASGSAAEVDREALQVALELVEEALAGRTLPSPQRAELIALVYDLVIAPEELPTAAITHIIRAASGGSK